MATLPAPPHAVDELRHSYRNGRRSVQCSVANAETCSSSCERKPESWGLPPDQGELVCLGISISPNCARLRPVPPSSADLSCLAGGAPLAVDRGRVASREVADREVAEPVRSPFSSGSRTDAWFAQPSGWVELLPPFEYAQPPDGEMVSIGMWSPADLVRSRDPKAGAKISISRTDDRETAELWRAELSAGRLPTG